jgi:AcrR family transcriptional regulator
VTQPNRREQKKQSTFAAIIDAASASFDEIGYDATAMEAIAESCGISVGTVYNYFGTKSAILAAIVTGEIDEIMGEAGARLNLDAQDPVDALMPVLELYVNQMTCYGSDLLKELFRAGFDPAQTELLADFVSADERVLVQLGQSLGAMRSRGLLSPEIDVNSAAILVYSIFAMALMVFTSIPGTTPVQVIATCESQLRIAFEGLAAR